MKKEMLTVAKWLVKESITQSEFDALSLEERAKAMNDINENNVEYIKELEENKATKEELSAALKSISDENAVQTKATLKAIEVIGTRVMEMSKSGVIDAPQTLKGLVSQNFDAIKGLRHNSGEVEIKAAFATASIAGNTDGTRDLSISELNTQYLTLRDIYPTENVEGSNNYIYTDWNTATTVRSAAMVAEGAAFPESTAVFVEKNITMHKVGDSIPVNEEIWEDEARFGNELEFFLRTNVAIKINDQLLNGDGTGENLTGLIASGTTYVPVAAGVVDANSWDVAQNMALVMAKLGKKFMPSHLLVNATEFYKMSIKKDGNNNYATAPFVSADGKNIGSMSIIIDNGVADNQMIALDSRYGKILQKVGIQVSRGLVNNQFLTDQETLKARERLNLLIKASNSASVQVCTSISAAKTAIAV